MCRWYIAQKQIVLQLRCTIFLLGIGYYFAHYNNTDLLKAISYCTKKQGKGQHKTSVLSRNREPLSIIPPYTRGNV